MVGQLQTVMGQFSFIAFVHDVGEAIRLPL